MMLLVNSPWTFDVSSFRLAISCNICKYSMVETEGRSLQEIEMSLNPNFSVRDKQLQPQRLLITETTTWGVHRGYCGRPVITSTRAIT
ncbi:hypothetical protein NC652_006561 [Populus alba x Populus x berolinensis]|nr:hypothetical protein NC652_006561 [Populus alba x Populus x berolinensis]